MITPGSAIDNIAYKDSDKKAVLSQTAHPLQDAGCAVDLEYHSIENSFLLAHRP